MFDDDDNGTQGNTETQHMGQNSAGRSRRGGWHPKPRQGYMYCREDSEVSKELWEHDPSRSTWNKFFKEQELESEEEDRDFDEHSWFEAEFRNEFHVSRRLFYYHLNILKESGEFDEKVSGDGTKGRRSHPLHLKLAFAFLRLTVGCLDLAQLCLHDERGGES